MTHVNQFLGYPEFRENPASSVAARPGDRLTCFHLRSSMKRTLWFSEAPDAAARASGSGLVHSPSLDFAEVPFVTRPTATTFDKWMNSAQPQARRWRTTDGRPER